MHDRLVATDRWFVANGLPWFVPERREHVRRTLRSRGAYLGLVGIVLAGLALGLGLAYITQDVAVAPATLINLTALALLLYVTVSLGGAPIVRWTVKRTLRSLPLLLPLVTRALPLLLLFVTFLFINAEVWQLSATLDGGVLWVVVLLFVAFAATFLVVRIPEEMDDFDRRVDTGTIVAACRRTPLADDAREIVERGEVAPVERTRLRGAERANLVLVLVIAQGVQVLLLALSVFVFFMLFGGLVMRGEVQASWTGEETTALPFLSSLSVELFQVSTFLAAFSGLYFAVYAVTDETYRDQFFTEVKDQLERAVAVRSIYVTLRADAFEPEPDPDDADPRDRDPEDEDPGR